MEIKETSYQSSRIQYSHKSFPTPKKNYAISIFPCLQTTPSTFFNFWIKTGGKKRNLKFCDDRSRKTHNTCYKSLKTSTLVDAEVTTSAFFHSHNFDGFNIFLLILKPLTKNISLYFPRELTNSCSSQHFFSGHG